MTIVTDPRLREKTGAPVLFWRNRIDPHLVGSEVVAHSGRVAIVQTTVTNVGKPMIVDFLIATRAHLVAWVALVNANPFNTTSLASYFSTGHTVIFRKTRPVEYRNMVLRDQLYDLDQDIFLSTHANYRKGFDRWAGVLNLIIVT